MQSEATMDHVSSQRRLITIHRHLSATSESSSLLESNPTAGEFVLGTDRQFFLIILLLYLLMLILVRFCY